MKRLEKDMWSRAQKWMTILKQNFCSAGMFLMKQVKMTFLPDKTILNFRKLRTFVMTMFQNRNLNKMGNCFFVVKKNRSSVFNDWTIMKPTCLFCVSVSGFRNKDALFVFLNFRFLWTFRQNLTCLKACLLIPEPTQIQILSLSSARFGTVSRLIEPIYLSSKSLIIANCCEIVNL